MLAVEGPQRGAAGFVGFVVRDGDGGVVEQDVELVVLGVYGLDGGCDGGVVVDVDLDRLEIVAGDFDGAVGCEGLDCLFCFADVAAADEDVVVSLRGELLGGVVAETLVGAGDEDESFGSHCCWL